MMQRKLDLRHNDLAAVLNLIGDMADSGEVRSGYRIKRVASTVDKMAQAQQNDCDSLKGLPLIGQKNRLQGNPESDGSPYSDAYCLPPIPTVETMSFVVSVPAPPFLGHGFVTLSKPHQHHVCATLRHLGHGFFPTLPNISFYTPLLLAIFSILLGIG